MTAALNIFDQQFAALTGFKPLTWQRRLFERLVKGDLPSALDLPTGLGKTSVMAIWLIARARGANLPRRLVYVVDRRAVVDQATDEAEKLRKALEGQAEHFNALDERTRAQAEHTAAELKKCLGFNEKRKLPISALRGAHVDNREWLDDPTAPAIIVGTVDMIGSRVLFSGYGVSRKMRPYHAGLLVVDALVVLDEAHLVPPFAHLLRAIERDPPLWPKDQADYAILPRFVALPLSAMQRNSGDNEPERASFHLEEEDWKTDYIAKQRLEAKKQVRLKPLVEKDQDKQLAEAAWALATKGGKFFRVAVFCDRRDKKDGSSGPRAQGVKEEIEKLAKGDRKRGHAEAKIHPIELLVSARRVYERETAAQSLRKLGFIGEKKPIAKPAILVATSAGEVGVDIDADHMVCDLVAWERMVQRLGRVNRRGEGDAEIEVFWSDPSVKDVDAPTEVEKRAQIAFASKAVIERLTRMDRGFDASPGSLRQLAENARTDAALKDRIDAATTPEPLRPALNRPLVDAWSMTSLEAHTGRPDVAPWLRGWVEEPPQTTIVWRNHMPIRVGGGGRTVLSDKAEIEDFFEAAPPHESEKLETETHRVVKWLQERANALLKRKRGARKDSSADAHTDPEAPADVNDTIESETAQPAPQARALRRNDIVALVLSSSGAYAKCYALGELTSERKGKEKDEFQDELVGKILIVERRFGGLEDGVLDVASEALPETADATEQWSKEAQFRVRAVEALSGQEEDGWRFEDDFVLCRDGEGTPLEWLVVEHCRDAAAHKEDARSISKPQELAAHQDWAKREMFRITTALGLSHDAASALAVGAGLHDEGKRASCWQRAFKAAQDAKKFGLSGPLAKTDGPIDQAILGHYRHEVGSLPCIEKDAEFNALMEHWRDLVLHLVAAHHGQARPVIETRGCDDGPPSLLEERARAVALRFARLQKRWGPWGLAWWETLMRAADQQASRVNEEGRGPSAKESAL